MAGFALTTLLLHLAGIGLGKLDLTKRTAAAIRVGGGALAGLGCILLAAG